MSKTAANIPDKSNFDIEPASEKDLSDKSDRNKSTKPRIPAKEYHMWGHGTKKPTKKMDIEDDDDDKDKGKGSDKNDDKDKDKGGDKKS